MLEIVRYFLASVYFILIGLICLPIMWYRGRHANNGQFFCSKMAPLSIKIMGVDYESRNLHHLNPKVPSIIIANHQHNLDLFFLGNLLPKMTVTIGKKSLKLIPLFGQLYFLSGSLYIDRENKAKAMDTIHLADDALIDKKMSIWIFPEGTRNKGKGLLDFKKGAFYMAVDAQVPIKIIACSSIHLLDLNKLKPGKVIVEALEPIETKGLNRNDIPELIKKCHMHMREHVAKLDIEILNNNKL